MEILHHGFTFNTNAMAAFSTGQSSTPNIYVNQNGLAFLELRRNGWPTPRFRHIQPIETRRLARKYKLEGILDIFKSEMCGSW